MKNLKQNAQPTVRRVRLIGLAMAGIMALAACGGGGGSPGVTGAGAITVGAGTVGAPGRIEFVSIAPTTRTIVVKGKSNANIGESATVTFKAYDLAGKALVDQVVTFTLPSTAVTLTSVTKKTGTDGGAHAVISSGISATTFRVVATLPGTAPAGGVDLTAQSEVISVVDQ
jgi:hypothetical protein